MEAPEKKKLDAQTVISIRHTGSHDEIGKVYHELYEWARANDVKIAGPGLTIFHSSPSEMDSQTAVFEVCLQVESPPKGDGRITVKELPACTVAYVTVKGPYDQIPAHYTELHAWLDVEGWELTGPPREVYIKRPDAAGGGDPNEFVTEIQFPVKD